MLELNGLSIEKLPEGAFGDVSFQEMWLRYNQVLASVHATALLPSKTRLVKLFLDYGNVNSFPFDILPEMTVLKELKMAFNSLTGVPVLHSTSLEILDLAYNQIQSLEEGAWYLPKLTTFRLVGNELMTLPEGMVSNMERLVSFECQINRLGPTLPKDLLNFASSTLNLINLAGNGISKLERGAITGNPLTCGCDLAWLVINEGLRFEVNGYCRDNEIRLRDLDPEDFLEPCP
ncbi:unnamed protein product [Darwinula stevensoni]|uniref:Uncharacterized protein n=1 Tax=Darwinula stevensoni TaxID=69355 RepID=A0A7R8X4F7_9CRUS|nr:unnamed protein product [Darwinula stevensoni]CAG0879487.1 unnamed protein product [Darwinula stevensoni]